MRNLLTTPCGYGADNMRTAVWSSWKVIHLIHFLRNTNQPNQYLYPKLHTYCTHLTHIVNHHFNTVNQQLYTFYTGPTITTNHI